MLLVTHYSLREDSIMTRLTYSEEPRDIWIVAETKDGALTPLTKELVYGARMAADMMGFYVKVALLGSGRERSGRNGT